MAIPNWLANQREERHNPSKNLLGFRACWTANANAQRAPFLRTEYIELKLEVPGLQTPNNIYLKIGALSQLFFNSFLFAFEEL